MRSITRSLPGPGPPSGSATAEVISSLLYNTPMRQIQIAMKLSF
jgi:hypothetical protein